jgi:diazepam-binding inhibitor (GABA receptor modulator, acyl-CoA-binding protein)
MEIQAQFDQAVARSRELPAQPNEVLLELYGLYKQATEGDVSGDAPGMFDFAGRAKHEAWTSRLGMSADDAMTAYVDLVNRLAAGG